MCPECGVNLISDKVGEEWMTWCPLCGKEYDIQEEPIETEEELPDTEGKQRSNNLPGILPS